jgi:Zn-dependent protease
VEHAVFTALIAYFVFLFSVVCHEAGHALAAALGGDRTAYHNGQVTLNPVPHIRQEPFGLGLLPLISLLRNMQSGGIWTFGFASAPFDPTWALRYPKRAAWMALAGPATNILIAILSGLCMKVGLMAGFFAPYGHLQQLVKGATPEGVAEPVAILLSTLFFLNFTLACFNLIPIPPLDGFSMLLFIIPASKVYEFLEIRNQYALFFTLGIFLLSDYMWDVILPVYIVFARILL